MDKRAQALKIESANSTKYCEQSLFGPNAHYCRVPMHPHRSIPLTRPITALSRCRHVDERSQQKTTKIIRQFFTRRARSTQPVCCSLLNTVKLHKLNGIENIADSDPAAWPTVKQGRSQP